MFSPSSMTLKIWVQTPFCAVICDIDRAITKYTFFGNGCANLHTIFLKNTLNHFKDVFIVFSDSQTIGVETLILLSYN